MARDESRNLIYRAVIPANSQKAVLEYLISKREERQTIK